MGTKLDKRNIEDIYPMSDISKGMIYYSLKDTEGGTYHNQMFYRVRDNNFDVELFRKAFGMMVEKHNILRTGFKMFGFDEPIQIVLKKVPLDIEFYEISHLDQAQQEEYINDFLTDERRQQFDFDGNGPLWRMKLFSIGSGNILFLWEAHHAMIDGWSTASLLTETNNTYITLKVNPNFVPNPLKSSYKDFIIRQMAGKRKEEVRRFWKEELADYKRFEFPGIPIGYADTSIKGVRRRAIPLKLVDLEKLKKTAASYGSSLKDLCFVSFVYMLNMLSYDDDLVVGLLTNNRPVCEDGDKIIGCFLNTIPVRIKIPAGIRCNDYINMVTAKMRQLKKYDMLPLFEITQVIGEETRGGNPISDTTFGMSDFHVLGEMQGDPGTRDGTGVEDSGLTVDNRGGTANTLFDFAVQTSDEFKVSINYSTFVLTDTDVDRLCFYFQTLLNIFITEPLRPLYKVDLIPGEEKKQLLTEFNNTKGGITGRSIHQEWLDQVERTPGNTAVVLDDQKLTYSQLNTWVDHTAVLLNEKIAGANYIVALMMGNSLEMVCAILAVLNIGGAYLPIDPEAPAGRKKYILKDSQAKVLLTGPLCGDISVLNGDSIDMVTVPDVSVINQPISVSIPSIKETPSELAYIVYTSGTSGRPKGVMVNRGGILNYFRWRIESYQLSETDVTLQPLPYYFDGFCSNFYSSLFSGGSLVLIPENKKMDYRYICETVNRQGITNVSLVPGMYEALLDISGSSGFPSLRFVVLAGERCGVSLLEKSIALNPGIRHINEYGPTETTVTAVANSSINAKNTGIIDRPITNMSVIILDIHLQLTPIAVPGELCVSGVGVARGYLNQPRLTAERFIQWSEKSNNVSQQSFHVFKIYRTGDLARRLPNGSIEYLGRLDQQVKIRGYRIELEEIQNRLLQHEAINDAVVVAHTTNIDTEGQSGEDLLCGYFVSRETIEPDAIKSFLADDLPEYMIPTLFMQVEKIPLTPNGKIDRKALPKHSTSSQMVSPRDETEEKLAKIWAEVLRIEEKNIGIDHNFFELGGHSLRATVQAAKIHKAFDVVVPLEDMFRLTTIRQLSGFIKNSGTEKTTFTIVEPVEKHEYYPLSSAQKRLYILWQMHPDTTIYNVPMMIGMTGTCNKQLIRRAFDRLIQRHESLRTTFHLVDGEPIQRVYDHAHFELEIHTATESDAADLVARFVKPFDLTNAPLIRGGILELDNGETVLMIDIHHIVTDGSSMEILKRDFIALYNDRTLPPLSVQYKDFAQWQNRLIRSGAVKTQEKYWLEEFSGQLPELDLPNDFLRPPLRSFEGNSIYFHLGLERSEVLKKIALQEEATLFMVILSIIYILFFKLTRQEDIILGTPIAGRKHPDLEQVVGFLVGTLAIRCHPKPERSFRDFLGEVREKTLKAYENQDFQFDDLVARLELMGNAARNPLFDVMVVFGNVETVDLKSHGSENQPKEKSPAYKHQSKVSRFDLAFAGQENDGNLGFMCEYAVRLFKEETIQRFIDYFLEIVDAVVENRDTALENINISHDLFDQEIEMPDTGFAF